MDYLNKKTIIVIIGILITASIYLSSRDSFNGNSISSSLQNSNTSNTETNISTEETTKDILLQNDISETPDMIYIDIDGAVNNPGVFKVSEGTRLYELIQFAGGLTVNAETKNINRADLVYDKQKIYIPEINETYISEEISNQVVYGANTKMVNINYATKEELDSLPGIGDTIAQRIIDFRMIKKFETIDEIMNVSGIAEVKFEQIKDLITVN